MRALIADDDRLSTSIVSHALVGWGFEVVTAQDGLEAWEVLRRDDEVALAILDWEMPGIVGPELCRRLRREVSRAHLYVLLLTTRQSRTDLIAGLDAGADDYLTKPLDVEELRARVHVGLRVVTLQQRLAERIRELEKAGSKISRLHGLLPICSYCKHVRTDQDYWQQVEEYLAHHSDLQFTHGICPQCYDAVLAEFERP